MTILAFILWVVIILLALSGHSLQRHIIKNNVHFYVTRDKNGVLVLWLGKPFRSIEYWVSVGNCVLLAAGDKDLKRYGINIDDYKDLKWEDEPKEVFLNLED